MEQTTKAIGIWIRVSTEDQAKGDSPEHHEKRARLYAESKGWLVKEVYHLEAMSGKSVMSYSETKRMLQDIRKGNISGLIFSKLARLARNTKELLEFADIFREENADLISLQEAIDTSSPAGRLFYTMIAAMAQWEREEISSRIAASIPIRAKLGKSTGGQPAIGYKWKNGQFVIDEQYAPVRRLTYELFMKLRRKKAVAKALNEKGYRTRSGALFSDTSVHRMIRDTTAKGERIANFTTTPNKNKKWVLKPASEWVILPCEPIVETSLWNECNRILDESEKMHKRKGRSAKHLLSGLVHCESCAKKMYVFHTNTQNPAYYCKPCKTRITVADLDEIYHGQLKEFLLTDISVSEYLQKLNAELSEKRKLLNAIVEEKGTIKKKMDNIIDLRINSEMTKEIFAEHYKPLEERMLQINDEVPELEAQISSLTIQVQSGDVVLHDAKDLYGQWNELTYENKRTIIETITDKITVGKEDIHIKLSYLPTAKPKEKTPPQTNSQNGGNSQHDLGIGGNKYLFFERVIKGGLGMPRQHRMDVTKARSSIRRDIRGLLRFISPHIGGWYCLRFKPPYIPSPANTSITTRSQVSSA